MEQLVRLSRICCAEMLSQASSNLTLESIIWQFYFLNVRPFLPRGFFTFLVAVAHGAPGDNQGKGKIFAEKKVEGRQLEKILNAVLGCVIKSLANASMPLSPQYASGA